MDNLLPRAAPRALFGVVRADASDPKTILAALQKSFEEFKAENDKRLSGKADIVVDEKVDRINASVGELQKAIDELNLKAAAAQLGGGEQVRNPEYTKAFAAHFRKGDVQAALTKGADADGGYLAPVEWDRTITAKLKQVSPIRQYATVQAISGAGFRKLFSDRNVGSGWVGETAARPATTTPQLGSLDWPLGEIYANPAASQQLLDDAEVNVEEWLADEVRMEFDRQEGIAFLSGDGANKPHGILTYVTGAANAARHPWGAITTVNSGAAAALTADGIINLIYSLPTEWAGNARFFANRQTIAAMRKLKDGQNNYLWQPSYQAGEPSTLVGVQVVDVPAMPNVGAGAVAMLYGDMAETYLVVDRLGIRVLRDPYTNKPFVHFYTSRRVGGGVKNPEAMRALVVAA